MRDGVVVGVVVGMGSGDRERGRNEVRRDRAERQGEADDRVKKKPT